LSRDLGAVGDTLAPLLFQLGIAALASAGALALYGALRPRERYVIEAGEVKQLATAAWLAKGKTAIEGALLTSLGQAFEHDRATNDLRARFAGYASAALLVGIVATAALAAIPGLRELGL
jgi:hypothetical protein